MKRRLPKSLFLIAAGLLALGVICAVALAAWVLFSHTQSVSLPAPGGQYAVGRTELDWTDTERVDPFAAGAPGPRLLPVWIWYPADAHPDRQAAAYLPPAWLRAAQQDAALMAYLDRDLARIQTHAVEDAPLAAARPVYPVLVMQPGLGPSVPDYTVLAESLASRGFVVVGLNEPGSSNIVVTAAGRVLSRSDLGTIPDNEDAIAAAGDLERIGAVWVADTEFALLQLEKLNGDPSSRFYQRLGMQKIGFFGHSFGGAAALAICQQGEARCAAGADLDGTPLSSSLQAGLHVPFLFFSEDYGQACERDANCALEQTAYQQAGGPAYFITLAGSRHFNFSDRPVRASAPMQLILRAMGASGAIDPARGLEVTDAYLAAFFGQYLQGVDSPLLSGGQGYPEAELSRR
jgi:hypothetical protein